MAGGGRATLTLHHFVSTTDIAKHHLGVDIMLFVVGIWWLWGWLGDIAMRKVVMVMMTIKLSFNDNPPSTRD